MRNAIAPAVVACFVLAVAQGAPGQPAKPAVAVPHLETAALDPAPGELGKAASAGTLVVLTAAKGKEVLLFDSSTGELQAYLESGAVWGKPQRLRGSNGEMPPAFHVASNGDQIAFASPRGVSVFDQATGALVAEATYLHHAAGIAATPDGWAVSLTRLPFPEIEKQDRQVFGGPAPQFVVVNEKLEIWQQGLAATSGQTPNQAAARSLRLAAGSAGLLFAAETANYKLYEFDHNLKPHAVLIEPTLQREEGGAEAGASKAEREAFLSEAGQKLARTGTDAAKPAAASGSKTPGRSEFFNYQTVNWDMAWDATSHQLIVLLAPDAVGTEGPALDLVDPTTGEMKRLLLRFPPGAAHGELVQLALGHRYLWLRNYAGRSPTFRLDRSALDQARKIGNLHIE